MWTHPLAGGLAFMANHRQHRPHRSHRPTDRIHWLFCWTVTLDDWWVLDRNRPRSELASSLDGQGGRLEFFSCRTSNKGTRSSPLEDGWTMDDVDGCAASLVGDAGLIVRNALREPWHGYATRLSQAPGSCGRKLRWQG